MKAYEKPMILASNDLFEGVFTASGVIEGVDPLGPEDLNLPVHDTVPPEGEVDTAAPEPAPETEAAPEPAPVPEAEAAPEPAPAPETEAAPEPAPAPETEAVPETTVETQPGAVDISCVWNTSTEEWAMGKRWTSTVTIPADFVGKHIKLTLNFSSEISGSYGTGSCTIAGSTAVYDIWGAPASFELTTDTPVAQTGLTSTGSVEAL